MREIKFRAWSTSTSTMYPLDPKIKNGAQLFDIYESGTWRVMQFTGLKDKDGKETYEGDILNWNNGAKGIVTWVNEECCFAAEAFDGSPGSWLTGSFEVIGNVYENPELLEG